MPSAFDSFADVVDDICAANEDLLRGRRKQRGRHALPSRAAVAAVVDDLRAVLFPGHFGATDLAPTSIRYYVGAQLDKLQVALTEQVRRGLSLACDHDDVTGAGECRQCDRQAVDVTEALVIHLPAIRRMLETDLKAAYASDPAANFLDETLYCYPGVLAITQHRIAHELHSLFGPPDPADHLGAGARRDRDRHSPGRPDRAVLLHRSRHRRGHRRDLPRSARACASIRG